MDGSEMGDAMTVLITGAGGFIGSHLVEAALQKGYRVRALIRYNSRNDWGNLEHLKSQANKSLEVHLGDVCDPYLMQNITAGCKVVFHLAALIGIPYSYHAPASYVAANIQGTLNVLEACQRTSVQRVIVTSTSEVYGTACYTPIDEKHPLQAQSPYAASKTAADKLAESYFCSFGLPVVTLRPFNTYGPRQSARAVIPTILAQSMAGEKTIRLGNLQPQRDLTYVEDTVRGFLLAAEKKGIEGETIHLGQGKGITIHDLAKRCLKITGSGAQIIEEAKRRRPEKSEVDILICSPAKAGQLLGWSPQISLNTGLSKTAEYIQQNLEQYQYKDYIV
jgi:NAD dependent epimerase/dehydratase